MKKFFNHLFSYIQAKLSLLINRMFEQQCRSRLKNKDFTIICSNCIGGIIYHRLGMRFLSPTINLWFYQDEFLKLIHNLPHYMKQDLKFIHSEWDFPVAMLDDIRIMFNHAKNEADAQAAWNNRRDRINYDNLYIILYDRDGITPQDIYDLKDVPCKRLVVLSEHEHPEIDYVKTIRKSPKSRPNSNAFLDFDAFGLRTFEKQFNFVSWLNGEDIY